MRILLVNTNQFCISQPLLPIGLCYLASAVEDAGHVVKILDLCLCRKPGSVIKESITTFEPDVVGLSIRSLDNSDSISPRSYIGDIKKYIDEIRHNTSAPVIIGGSAVSIAGNMLIDYLDADYAIVEEGESAFIDLLDSLASGKPNIDKISSHPVSPDLYRFHQGISQSIIDKLDIRQYLALGAPYPVQTKRECELNCIYSTHPCIEGSSYKYRSIDSVADEIDRARMNRFKSVEFIDSVFNHPMEHAVNICEELISRNLKIPLYTTCINPSQVTASFFRLMERAGFCGIASNLESASDKVLDKSQKGYTCRDIYETVRYAKMTSMCRIWIFTFGNPGETEVTAKETLRFISKYLDGCDIVLAAIGIRIYPGTELEQIAQCEGIINQNDNLLFPAFYFSPEIRKEDLLKLISQSGLSSSSTFIISNKGISSQPLFQRICMLIHYPQPYWYYTNKNRRI